MIKLSVLFSLLIALAPVSANNIADYIDGRCGNKCTHVGNMIHEAVQIASESHQVEPNVIIAVMQVESNFNPKAQNMSNKGLMQVNLKYHREKFKGTNPMNVYANVYVGTYILKECMDKRRGNLSLALVCYNGGGDPRYVRKVKKVLADLNQKKVTS